ncbi:MAG: LemA family protein [Lachnospiraceae bacterium]|nr:LemA family protein [Lachnospiraceae bacterium]
MNSIFIIVIVVIVIVLAAVIMTVEYNSLVVLRNRVDNQSAQVDVQLKRRAELIPNLIEIVKGYAEFEKSTLTNIAQLRSEVINSGNTSEACAADAKLGRICSQVLAIGESYPELKANTNFLKLQEELSETENKIVMARQFYNDIITKYNTAVQVFPKSVMAGIFGFKRKELLEISHSEREPIKLDSNTFQF